MAKTKSIENFFNNLDFYSNFLPVLFFLFYFKKSRGIRVFWLIVIYDLYSYLANLGLLYLDRSPMRIFLYSFFTLAEYLLFSFILFYLIESKIFKKLILIIGLCFIAFITPYNLLVKIRGIDSIPIGIETLLILIFSFLYFYEQMNDETTYVYNKFSFWIVFGMMIYLSGSFFIYIYGSHLPNEKDIASYWIVTNIVSVLKNIFFTIAIVIHARSAKKTKKPADYLSIELTDRF